MMKRALYALALGFMLAGCGLSSPAIGQGADEQLQAKRLARSVTIEEAKAEMGSEPKLLVIDVREPHEYAAGHVPQAVNYPLGSVSRWSKDLDPKAHVLTLCRSGHRSSLAAAWLADHGFNRAETMTGGMLAWTAAGYPVTLPASASN